MSEALFPAGHRISLPGQFAEDAPGETWAGIDSALRTARRGLPGGSSLAKLLREVLGIFGLECNGNRDSHESGDQKGTDWPAEYKRP
jgi:hypothetical protein